MPRPRVLLIVDTDRPPVASIIDDVRKLLRDHAEVVAELDTDMHPLDGGVRADLAVVLGGDGTLLAQGRRLVDAAIPLVGVNVGRLAFLAEFDWDSLQQQADAVFGGRAPIRERMILAASVQDESGTTIETTMAINDCVVTAGPPFRMIELQLRVDGAEEIGRAHV